ncbi:MAG TPA: [Fe-Fe] hydrogenase large subunit C-terminal domain-containing protein [Candidatus Hydrogenedentes bacterium]|nr:[Fe-Fe] hydrogenase large subunit C-terminal domain-containing protein [Candidatus Hydrogenedentota bacterium]
MPPKKWQRRPGQVVFTHTARCRDCYRCLRACPVKAIRVVDGQAYVDADRCIACGTCIRECPQHAKQYRRDLDRAERLMAGPGAKAASVAPSFAALFGPEDRDRLPAALRRLGFDHVGETAVGAFESAALTGAHVRAHPGRQTICTACPAVVAHIEQYAPDLASRLAPVASPMIAHARLLKERHGPDTKVFFFGPCVTKKAEAERPELAGDVDCVLTFGEMCDWLAQRDIALADCPPGAFDETPPGESRFFPVPGGLARTAGLATDLLDTQVIAVSGAADLEAALDALRRTDRPVVLEPLFCAQGCVNGPGMPAPDNPFARRTAVLDYAGGHPGAAADPAAPVPAAVRARGAAAHAAVPGPREVFPEDDVEGVLRALGKEAEEDRLNCGACGYGSCREHAEAVLSGMAAPEMCIPHMRRLAEQRGDRIIETTPNGVLIVDSELKVLGVNPAFRRLFQCGDGVLGRHVSCLMDAEPFERVLASGEPVEQTVRHENYHKVCHELVYPLTEDRQIVGIFVDITRTAASEESLERLRAETARKAKELLDHQLGMAQELARFLGASTAQSEELVRHLMTLAGARRDPEGGA